MKLLQLRWKLSPYGPWTCWGSQFPAQLLLKEHHQWSEKWGSTLLLRAHTPGVTLKSLNASVINTGITRNRKINVSFPVSFLWSDFPWQVVWEAAHSWNCGVRVWLLLVFVLWLCFVGLCVWFCFSVGLQPWCYRE